MDSELQSGAVSEANFNPAANLAPVLVFDSGFPRRWYAEALARDPYPTRPSLRLSPPGRGA